MQPERKKQMLAALAVILVGAVVALWINTRPSETAPPPGSGYYTGAMRSKFDPNVWVTADGKIVPPPPGTQPIYTSARRGRPGTD
ncbi:MAG TPA: hypothetical protein VFB21_15060 [Chthonomonadaceae bacterium]|nr:hypothetical protein [Chthonomonadaceae bacterium]